MLIKFETKSTRVKGLAFHPHKKWILASLHNGVIQLWDYEEKTLIGIFDEHKGPVRGLDFHPVQPLFVSGGDDAKIKLWDTKRSRKCIFSIDAHEDYIRTTYFHREHPWIVSASDDQSIRIWNWQSRNRVVVLTGHTHYVMCAQIHPKRDLILSTSIDQTLRLWDISPLTSKSKAKEDTGLPEILTRTDYSVESKDAHASEINWCSFHPNPERDLCLSAADDHYIKVWKYDRYGLTEQYVLRGHYKNVNCAVFHPTKDLLISASEDGNVKCWDLDKRASLADLYIRKESERFWTIAGHPKEDLFAAGHDTGLMVFKTVRQRPAYCVSNNFILFTKGNRIHAFSMSSRKEINWSINLKPKKETEYYCKIDCFKFEAINEISRGSEHKLLVTTRSSTRFSQGSYRLYTTRQAPDSAPSPVEGTSATFIAQSRYAAVASGGVVKFFVNGQEIKRKEPLYASEVFYAGPGKLYCKHDSSQDKPHISLFDIESNAHINKLYFDAKRVVTSEDMKFVACFNSNRIVFCDSQLNRRAEIIEQRKIKSACWDNHGVLIYTTHVQVKYALFDGHTSTLCSTPETLYVVAVRDDTLFCLNRKSELKQMRIDPMEFRFKQAVVRKDRRSILSALSKLRVLSRAEISFLVQKGYPDLALRFVEDVHSRFPLALQAYAIDEALESAAKINSKQCWEQLAETAMQIGHVKAIERAYKELKKPYKLALLYLCCGQRKKLCEARELAKELGDTSNEYNISVLLKDYAAQSHILERCGLVNLAYCCAVNHGLYDLAERLSHQLSAEHLERLPPLETAKNYVAPPVKFPLDDPPFENWPLLNDDLDSVDDVLVEEPEVPVVAEENGDWSEEEDLKDDDNPAEEEEEFEALEDAQEDGWNEDDGDNEQDDEQMQGMAQQSKREEKKFTPPNPGRRLTSEWSRISDLAVHHVLAGSYTSATALLKNQVGLINVEPLSDIFKDIFLQSRVAYRGIALYPTLYTYPTSDDHQSDVALPAGGYKLDDVEKLLADCYGLFSRGRFSDAIVNFRTVILKTLLVQTDDADAATNIIKTCKEYILGLKIWLERKNISGKEAEARICELTVYFSKLNMAKHKFRVLEEALKVFIKRPDEYKKTQAAASVARRFLFHPGSGDPSKHKLAEQAESIKRSYDVQEDQRLKLDYDDHNPYSLCAASYKPIWKNNDSTKCPLCDATYLPKYRGEVCQICDVAEIGRECSGIRFKSVNFD